MIQSVKFFLEKNRFVKKAVLYVYINTYGRYMYYKRNKVFLKNAREVLETVDKVFNELETEYWLDFGTLLGAYRNKNFLEHDLDLDFGAYLHEYSEKTEEIFKKHGFKKTREFLIDEGKYGREETYQYLGVPIDIFYYTRFNDTKAYYHDFRPIDGLSRDLTVAKKGGLVPREITLSLSSVGTISFLGTTYPVPEPVEKHLEDRYGSDFMVENISWNTDNEINENIKILTDKIGVRRVYE